MTDSTIKYSSDYIRGYEHGWKECLSQMLQPLIKAEMNALPKPMVFKGFTIVTDETLPKGQVKMRNDTGEEITLNLNNDN